MESTEFQQLREKMRLSQKDLAAKLDVTETTIWRWEKGKNPIPTIVELAMKQIRLELMAEDAEDFVRDDSSRILFSVPVSSIQSKD